MDIWRVQHGLFCPMVNILHPPPLKTCLGKNSIVAEDKEMCQLKTLGKEIVILGPTLFPLSCDPDKIATYDSGPILYRQQPVCRRKKKEKESLSHSPRQTRRKFFKRKERFAQLLRTVPQSPKPGVKKEKGRTKSVTRCQNSLSPALTAQLLAKTETRKGRQTR